MAKHLSYFHKITRLRKTMDEAFQQYETSLREAKTTAYRMAENYIGMKQFPEEFDREVPQQDRRHWIRSSFNGLIVLGGNPHHLIEAVERGMTLDDYLGFCGAAIPSFLLEGSIK